VFLSACTHLWIESIPPIPTLISISLTLSPPVQDEERAALDAQHARGLIPVAGTFDGSGWAPHLRSAAVPLAALIAHEAAAAAEAADRLLAEQWQAREDERAATLAREARSKEKQQQPQHAKQRQQAKPKPVQNQRQPASEQSGEQASKAQPAQPRPQPRPKQQQPHEQAQKSRQRDRPQQRAPSASPADGAAASASSADGESIKKSA
jgi:outer membrane biosynthesis protein TonB